MVAEENLPWSAGCCGNITDHRVSQVTPSHLPKGRFSCPRRAFSPSGECGEQVPLIAAPACERVATPSLRVNPLTWVRKSRSPGKVRPARSQARPHPGSRRHPETAQAGGTGPGPGHHAERPAGHGGRGAGHRPGRPARRRRCRHRRARLGGRTDDRLAAGAAGGRPEGLRYEALLEQGLFVDGEAAEGIRAFIAKRAPDFASEARPRPA